METRQEKIMVVDDEAHIVELVELYLGEEGFLVESATDGDEAVEKFARLKPDLVVLDIMLPGMDGLDELRTPLTSIEGFSQALLDGVSRGEDEERRSLEIISQESKRLVRVLNDLLLLSQMDAGELHPEKSPVDVIDLMRKMDGLYHARADDGGFNLVLDTVASPVTLDTDPDRLELVLTNLLDNAMEHTDPGGTITLSCAVGMGAVNISVADTGQGIEPELLPRIFERFYRVGKPRSTGHGGAGLGLSICKELVETLGGRIRVESLPGEGTTFTVTLPL